MISTGINMKFQCTFYFALEKMYMHSTRDNYFRFHVFKFTLYNELKVQPRQNIVN